MNANTRFDIVFVNLNLKDCKKNVFIYGSKEQEGQEILLESGLNNLNFDD